MSAIQIGLLPAAHAAAERERGALAALVNRAYVEAEQGLFAGAAPRTSADAMAEAIAAGWQVVAQTEARVVGALHTRLLDAHGAWLGAVAVDVAHAGTGLGRALVGFAEALARERGARAMQIEVLAPRPMLPHFERLAAWYGRLGYRAFERFEMARLDADAAAKLTRPCDVVVMRKPLG